MSRIWLSLGSNLAREPSLRGAVQMLREAFGPLVLSGVYESAAVGFAGEPFLNLVAGADTDWPVEAVRQRLRAAAECRPQLRIEAAQHRVPFVRRDLGERAKDKGVAHDLLARQIEVGAHQIAVGEQVDVEGPGTELVAATHAAVRVLDLPQALLHRLDRQVGLGPGDQVQERLADETDGVGLVHRGQRQRPERLPQHAYGAPQALLPRLVAAEAEPDARQGGRLSAARRAR